LISAFPLPPLTLPFPLPTPSSATPPNSISLPHPRTLSSISCTHIETHAHMRACEHMNTPAPCYTTGVFVECRIIIIISLLLPLVRCKTIGVVVECQSQSPSALNPVGRLHHHVHMTAQLSPATNGRVRAWVCTQHIHPGCVV
jgi:hypothetical protein